jgi:alkylhydroperoxidase family enzyme
VRCTVPESSRLARRWSRGDATSERDGAGGSLLLVDALNLESSGWFEPKMQAMLRFAWTVRREPLDPTSADVATARAAGATDADVQLAVLIASAFSMYNRLVDGFAP